MTYLCSESQTKTYHNETSQLTFNDSPAPKVGSMGTGNKMKVNSPSHYETMLNGMGNQAKSRDVCIC